MLPHRGKLGRGERGFEGNFVRRASLTKRRCQMSTVWDAKQRRRECCGGGCRGRARWSGVGIFFSLFTGCQAGRRGAVGENDGGRSGSFLSVQLASSLLDAITCKLTVVVNATIAVCINKETCGYKCTRRSPERDMCLSPTKHGHVFSFFSQEAAKGPRQNGETGRSTGQRWEDLGGNTTTQTKNQIQVDAC
jgi:hypothetical protein